MENELEEIIETICYKLNNCAKRYEKALKEYEDKSNIGTWHIYSNNLYDSPRWRCSECGTIERTYKRWGYCPVCGAMMKYEKIKK